MSCVRTIQCWLGKNSVINKLILVLLLAYRDYEGRLNSAQTLFELCLSTAAQITRSPGAPPSLQKPRVANFVPFQISSHACT